MHVCIYIKETKSDPRPQRSPATTIHPVMTKFMILLYVPESSRDCLICARIWP